MEFKRDQDIRVHCPKCSFNRLFDCTTSAEGIIKIKCPSCKNILVINLQQVVMNRQKKRRNGYQKLSDNKYIITEPRISMEV